jgi:HTH-type transcriptional regulator / antitoxin HigA
MSDSSKNQYQPDIVSPPGETLQELLESIGMTQADLAERTGRPKKTINEIIKGKTAITPETAIQFERVLGVPATFWNNRERTYRENLAQLAEQERLQSQIDWLKTIPFRKMVELGWIQALPDKAQQLDEVLKFFSVASPDLWKKIWLTPDAVYRKSPAFESDPGATAAWLRKGEIDANCIACEPFEENNFRAALDYARALTTSTPDRFVPELKAACAQCGVAVTFVHELPGTRASGATRWLSPTKALIQLSLRHKTDDHLWFTFFHEAGHILLHGKRDFFIEGDDGQNEKEHEADQFARDLLIPASEFRRFHPSGLHYSKTDIVSFATQIGIAPGIVVGRLQHDGRLPPTHCNELKLRLAWG